VWLEEPRLHYPLRRRFPIWDASGESWPAHPGGQLRDRRLLEFWLAFELHFEAVRRFRAGAGLRLKKLGGQCVELRFPTRFPAPKQSLHLFARQAGAHGGPAFIGRQFHRTSELMHAFDHPAEADSQSVRSVATGLQRGRRNALPPVAHFEVNRTVCKHQANGRCGTFRVPMDVGQTFLKDSENCQLGVARKASDLWVDVAVDLNSAAFRETFDIPGYCRAQADFLEHWRIKKIRYCAHLLHALIGHVNAFLNLRVGTIVHGVQAHFQSGEVLADAIVELAAEAPPLFILHAEEMAG